MSTSTLVYNLGILAANLWDSLAGYPTYCDSGRPFPVYRKPYMEVWHFSDVQLRGGTVGQGNKYGLCKGVKDPILLTMGPQDDSLSIALKDLDGIGWLHQSRRAIFTMAYGVSAQVGQILICINITDFSGSPPAIISPSERFLCSVYASDQRHKNFFL